MSRRIRQVDRRHDVFVFPLGFVVYHQHWKGTLADHTLDGSSDKDVEQELLAVCPHNDEVSVSASLRSRSQDAIKRIACDNHGPGLDSLNFGDRCQLFGQQAFSLAFLHLHEFIRLVVVDDVDNM
jgi:hypothetical protein